MRAFDLTGKVAVATGGNSGIGLRCAIGLAKAVAQPAVWGRDLRKNEVALAKLNRIGVGARSYQVGVNDRAQI